MPVEPPKVTGLSPKEGPPGTKITIRGENLGVSQQDIIGLTICGVDCLMYAEWKSPSKIIARCGAGSAGRGDVTVVTRSGGKGTCTVQFRCFLEPIDLTKESAIWVDESHMITVSYGRNRPTSPSQIHPDDPLKLSDEGNISKFPEEELHDMFPEGSGNLLSENFVPSWYLLENHNGASFDALQAGLSCLRWKVGQRKEGPIAFLKSNVLSIVDCLDVLVSLQALLKTDKAEAGSDLTSKLEKAITKSKQHANSLFQDVLARKDKADSTRNALGVLQRFRFLFNLPASIERNIQKGDYDVVINDYARAKQLFHDTEVAVFKKVYQEVEQIVEKFREMLTGNLKKMPCSMDEQKKLIKYLVNLEALGDPAWESIQHITTWLISSMNTCRDGYLETVAVLEKETEDDQSIASESNWENDTPQVVLFVDEITKFYSDHFPELWKLGQAYLNRQLYTREIQDQTGINNIDKQIAFKTMVQDVTNRLCNLLRAALLSHTLHSLHIQQLANLGCWPKSQSGEVLKGWLPHCIRSIRQCYSSVLKLELPENILNIIQQLLFDIRVFSMTSLFNQASDDVRNLYLRETWDVEIDDQNGATTQLPLLFENIVVETLQRIKETVLYCGPKETEIFSQINVQANIKQLSQTLLQAFIVALEKMAFSSESEKSTERLFPPLSDINSDNYQDVTSRDKRLLIILSNTTYTTQIIIPRLQENFQKYGYPDMSLVVKCSQAKYRELESKLFRAYLERKCDPIVGAIEPKMYANHFNWKTCPKPTGVSVYVKNIIMNMIAVHAEVFSVSPPFVEKIMTRIVESVIEELSRLYQCVGKFLWDGNVQATLDNRALEETLQGYKTYNSGKSFKICHEHLSNIGDQKDKMLLEELLKKFRSQMQMQLLCFSKEKVVSV